MANQKSNRTQIKDLSANEQKNTRTQLNDLLVAEQEMTAQEMEKVQGGGAVKPPPPPKPRPKPDLRDDLDGKPGS